MFLLFFDPQNVTHSVCRCTLFMKRRRSDYSSRRNRSLLFEVPRATKIFWDSDFLTTGAVLKNARLVSSIYEDALNGFQKHLNTPLHWVMAFLRFMEAKQKTEQYAINQPWLWRAFGKFKKQCIGISLWLERESQLLSSLHWHVTRWISRCFHLWLPGLISCHILQGSTV